jgi:hypothetical protein
MTDANEMTIAIEEPEGGWYQPERDEPANDKSADREGGRLVLRPGTTTDEKMGFGIDEITGLPVGKGHGLGRVPVVVLTGPPARRRKKNLPGQRRPVVAVLDTFVDPEEGVHPWLGHPTDVEPFVADIWTPKGNDVPPARHPGPIGPDDKAAGHGTFIAGLIRQLAPDAEVIMMRVMHPDGKVLDDHLMQALGELLERVQAGIFVDVICLALGFHIGKDSRDADFAKQLRHVLGELGNLGVRVVASAGNNRDCTHRIYPAALATAGNQPKTGLISVGSYDPDGKTCSTYSPPRRWITNREVGTDVVSTIPAFQGPGKAGQRDTEEPRPYDPDDFSCGFARWSGTSFAAGIAAGRLAQALVNPAVVDPALDRHQRAEAALAALTPLEAC